MEDPPYTGLKQNHISRAFAFESVSDISEIFMEFLFFALLSCKSCFPMLFSIDFSLLYQLLWIFVINQVPCVSACWGEKTHPLSATKGGNPIPATTPVAKKRPANFFPYLLYQILWIFVINQVPTHKLLKAATRERERERNTVLLYRDSWCQYTISVD